MTTTNTKLETDLSSLMGLDGLTDEEKVVFLNEIGDLVLESALLRLVADLTDDQQEALDQFLEAEPDADTLMKHLLAHHANFETLLEEEMVAIREETQTVMSGS